MPKAKDKWEDAKGSAVQVRRGDVDLGVVASVAKGSQGNVVLETTDGKTHIVFPEYVLTFTPAGTS